MKRILIVLVLVVSVVFNLKKNNNNMNIAVNFISGVSLGIEFYTGEDLVEGDKFACTIDLLIVRFTFVVEDN